MSKYVKVSEMDDHQRELYEAKKKAMAEKRRRQGSVERPVGRQKVRKKALQKNLSVYVADFETASAKWFDIEGETFVWAWAITNVHPEFISPLDLSDNAIVKTNRYILDKEPIQSFIDELKSNYYPNKTKIYFHNLKFDGAFLLTYFINNKYKDMSEQMYGVSDEDDDDERKTLPDNSFAILGDSTVWYSIKVNIEGKNIEFRDSLKRIPMKVKEMAYEYNLPILKGEIDYDRDPHLPMSAEEEKYIRHDVLIVAEVLRQQYREGFTELTTASFSYNNYKRFLKQKGIDIKEVFGGLSKDASHFARRAYEGGEVFCNPDYQGQFLGDPFSNKTLGFTWDINSMYPAVYSCMPMPYGEPTTIDSAYDIPYVNFEDGADLRNWRSNKNRYFVEIIECIATLKVNHIPSISINVGFNKRVFPKTIAMKDKVLADVRFEMLLADYDIVYLNLGRVDVYKARQDLFFDYIKQIVAEKNRAGIEGNRMRKSLAKVKMNSLYGKFAQREEVVSATFIINADGELESKHYMSVSEIRYVPLASIITAEARCLLVTQANKFGYKYVVYMDTDSIHTLAGHHCKEWRRRQLPQNKEEKYLQMSNTLTCDELYQQLLDFEYGHPDEIYCDEYDLGAFKIESQYTCGKWLRAKTYFEGNPVSDKEVEEYYAMNEEERGDDYIIKGSGFNLKGCIKGAGIPDNSKQQITVDNFTFGLVLYGKLLPTRVKGGVVLRESLYEIKEELTLVKTIDKTDKV